MKDRLRGKDVRLIAFDLDETMLGTDREFSEYTLQVLNKAAEAGFMLVPISGRSLERIRQMMEDIKGVQYVIASNGAIIADIRKDVRLHSQLMDKEKAVEVYDLTRELGEKPILTIRGYIFREPGTKSRVKTLPVRTCPFKEKMDALIAEKGLREGILAAEEGVGKITIIFDSVEKKYNCLERYQAIEDVVVTYSRDDNVEVNAPEATKGQSLKVLAEMLSIPMENIMAIGDGTNDTTMIASVGLGVAMGNAYEEVKRVAKYVTLSNAEDGAAKAIEKLLL